MKDSIVRSFVHFFILSFTHQFFRPFFLFIYLFIMCNQSFFFFYLNHFACLFTCLKSVNRFKASNFINFKLFIMTLLAFILDYILEKPSRLRIQFRLVVFLPLQVAGNSDKYLDTCVTTP